MRPFSATSLTTGKQGFNQLAKFAQKLQCSTGRFVDIDFSACTFFDANLTATFEGILADFSARRGVKTQLSCFRPRVLQSLQQNGFLELHGFGKAEDRFRTTLPFRRFQLSQSDAFARYLSENLVGHGIPAMSQPLQRELNRSILELFSNAASHSESEVGVFVCGQFYPKLGHLDLTIADAGIGIPGRVRRYFSYGGVPTLSALRWAMQEGTTTRTGQEPGGLGLKLLKDFVTLNGGRIQIATLDGFLEYHQGSEHLDRLDASIPGTTINLRINTVDTNSYRLASELTPDEIF